MTSPRKGWSRPCPARAPASLFILGWFADAFIQPQQPDLNEITSDRENGVPWSVRKPRPTAITVEPERQGSIPQGLSHPFEANSDPVAIAGELVRIVQEIASVLTPILGSRGVAALYQRALHVARSRHPWLAESVEVVQPTIDLVALKAAFAQQDRTEATAAATAVLHSFHDLLASLIGGALCERLLDPVWAHSPRRLTALDKTP